MIVHRLLDAFFRTLDAVDAVRDRVDRALGREPRPDPWAVEWPPAEPDLPHRPETEPAPKNGASADAAESRQQPAKAEKAEPEQKKTDESSKKAAADKKPADKPKTKTKKSAKPKPKPVKNKKSSSSRKGSVDRSGKDFDSPRARAIHDHLVETQAGRVTDEADLDGKKVLGRVVWALKAADEAGSEMGLTTADVSALLSLSADIEVYATNIGRACRDHGELIEESEPDGRSKRYRLTAEGKKRAQEIETRDG